MSYYVGSNVKALVSTFNAKCIITREKLIDEQNAMINGNWELDVKLAAYGTKEEQLTINKKSVFERFNSK